MADIPSSRAKINDIEVSADAPVTEALMNKFGADINDYLDKELNYLEILSSTTWTAPDQINWVIIEASGGGGGGGSGGAGPGGGGFQGGSGGGAPIIRTPVKVTPGNVYTVTIGAGGASDANGSSTTFIGADASLTFPGGDRGKTPDYDWKGVPSGTPPIAAIQSFVNTKGGRSVLGSAGGADGYFEATSIVPYQSGEASIYASGTNGGCAFGPGGNIGAPATVGGSAAANSGAGGGGGGAAAFPVLGGAGGSGRLRLYWYGNA